MILYYTLRVLGLGNTTRLHPESPLSGVFLGLPRIPDNGELTVFCWCHLRCNDANADADGGIQMASSRVHVHLTLIIIVRETLGISEYN
jgi:hypothetical protein